MGGSDIRDGIHRVGDIYYLQAGGNLGQHTIVIAIVSKIKYRRVLHLSALKLIKLTSP